jgi:hypothetical protein
MEILVDNLGTVDAPAEGERPAAGAEPCFCDVGLTLSKEFAGGGDVDNGGVVCGGKGGIFVGIDLCGLSGTFDDDGLLGGRGMFVLAKAAGAACAAECGGAAEETVLSLRTIGAALVAGMGAKCTEGAGAETGAGAGFGTGGWAAKQMACQINFRSVI